jgi:hypothetical protein
MAALISSDRRRRECAGVSFRPMMTTTRRWRRTTRAAELAVHPGLSSERCVEPRPPATRPTPPWNESLQLYLPRAIRIEAGHRRPIDRRSPVLYALSLRWRSGMCTHACRSSLAYGRIDRSRAAINAHMHVLRTYVPRDSYYDRDMHASDDWAITTSSIDRRPCMHAWKRNETRKPIGRHYASSDGVAGGKSSAAGRPHVHAPGHRAAGRPGPSRACPLRPAGTRRRRPAGRGSTDGTDVCARRLLARLRRERDIPRPAGPAAGDELSGHGEMASARGTWHLDLSLATGQGNVWWFSAARARCAQVQLI